jgi:CDP-diacylglycerol pyrophosphatase
MQLTGLPFPCEHVSIDRGLDRGFDVLRAPPGSDHLLLVPTRTMSGIESPLLRATDTPNYWQAAWGESTRLSDTGAPIPRDEVGLVVNSVRARTQDQLHIHISCVRPELRDALARHAAEMPLRLRRLGFSLAGRRYMGMKVEASTLNGINPIALVAAAAPAVVADRGLSTIAVIGARLPGRRQGFYILSSLPGEGVGDEEMLDRTCAALARP